MLRVAFAEACESRPRYGMTSTTTYGVRTDVRSMGMEGMAGFAGMGTGSTSSLTKSGNKKSKGKGAKKHKEEGDTASD